MSPLEQLKSMLAETYISEDGDRYEVEILPGLTDTQINDFAKQLPSGLVPEDIRELLQFASGFKFFAPEEITFNTLVESGNQLFFPHGIGLASDGFGNEWVLDVDDQGNWGSVFFVSHDPAVIVRQSNDLAQFIEHIDEFGKDEKTSHLNATHEETVFTIRDKNPGFIDVTEARQSTDHILKDFALSVPDDFAIADLRHKPNGSGFAWGKFGPAVEKSMRHPSELIWALEKKQKRKGFFSKLFG